MVPLTSYMAAYDSETLKTTIIVAQLILILATPLLLLTELNVEFEIVITFMEN